MAVGLTWFAPYRTDDLLAISHALMSKPVGSDGRPTAVRWALVVLAASQSGKPAMAVAEKSAA